MGVADTKRSVRAPRSTPLRTGSGSSTIFNVLARIVAWYLLYTVLFRCPDVPTNDSPTICHTAHTVSTTLRPHLEPYYNQYVEPYVSEYAPYVKRANEDYFVPAYDKATDSYKQYAAPHVSCSRDYVIKEYNRAVKPRVDQAEAKAKVYYDEYLSPHVAKGGEFYSTVQPHIAKVQKTVEEAYRDILIPAYETALPHVIKAYEQTKHVVLTIVAPMVRANGEKAVYWGVGIWSDIVRPQVGRIGERLGGAGNGTPAASVPGSLFSSLTNADASKATAASSSLDSVISSASAKAASAKSSASSSAASQAEANNENPGSASADGAKKLTVEEVHAIIEEDLTSHAQKFKDSAVETSDNLNVQIDEISTEAQTKKASYVKKEIAALEKLVETEFNNIKKATLKITSGLAPGSDAEKKQSALDSLFTTTRDAGIKIRDKAQEQRLESQKYLAKIYDDVAAAADNHLEVFDSVLDLTMQELGMKWAWMDHVSYKEWRRYHAMKKEFEGLKRDIVTAAQRNQKLIEVTRWVESDWEGRATNIAKDAAEELKRLKRVSKKKIELADASDDFSDSVLLVSVEKAGQQILKKVEEAKEVVTSGAKEQFATGSIASAASAVSEKIYGTEPNAAEKVATAISEAVLGTEEPTPLASSASSVASAATEAVKAHVPGGVYAGFVAASRVEYENDPDEEILAKKLSSAVDAASDKLADVSRAVSEALAGAAATQAVGGKYASIASEKYDSALSAASSALYGTPQPAGESIVSIATDKYSAAVAAASSVIYGTPTPKVELFASQAKELYERAQTSAKDEYHNAASAASEVIYGTPQPFTESVASVAGEYASAATNAAEDRFEFVKAFVSELVSGKEPAYTESVMSRFSSLMYGTKPPVISRATSAVGEAYDSAFSLVSESYESATSTVGSMMTPPPAIESIISAANEQVQAAITAASVQVYGTTQGTVESISSVVGEAYGSAASQVSEAIYGRQTGAFESATLRMQEAAESAQRAISEAVYGTSKGTFEYATSAVAEGLDSATSVIGENYAAATDAVSDGMGAAGSAINESYEQAQARISAAIYGPQQGVVESAQSRISEAVESAKSSLSEIVYGTQAGYAEQAASSVSSVASAVSSAVEETVEKATEKVKEVYSTVRDEL